MFLTQVTSNKVQLEYFSNDFQTKVLKTKSRSLFEFSSLQRNIGSVLVLVRTRIDGERDKCDFVSTTTSVTLLFLEKKTVYNILLCLVFLTSRCKFL